MNDMNIDTYLINNFKGKKIFYKPNPGNGGDAIIAHATFKIFKKLNLNYTIIKDNTELKGQHVLYGGGGNFIENYGECANFIETISKKVASITILPHTITGNETILKKLDDRATIICRERKSYEYVSSFKNINNVLLFDDMAVGLSFSNDELATKHVNRLIYLAKPKDLLWNIYHRKRKLSYYLKNRSSNRTLNSFRIDVEKTTIEIPNDNLDVSATFNLDSSMTNEALVNRTALTIASFLNQFDIINTNRLHVCITSAILGKRVNFYSNSYWKNESIYQFSLKKKFPNINWIQ
jgi:exopolysaccharide biosynthesis predicted pyruvyltransferase EpsI